MLTLKTTVPFVGKLFELVGLGYVKTVSEVSQSSGRYKALHLLACILGIPETSRLSCDGCLLRNHGLSGEPSNE